MKKLIIKILLIFSIFFGFNNYVNAELIDFDLGNIKKVGNTITITGDNGSGSFTHTGIINFVLCDKSSSNIVNCKVIKEINGESFLTRQVFNNDSSETTIYDTSVALNDKGVLYYTGTNRVCISFDLNAYYKSLSTDDFGGVFGWSTNLCNSGGIYEDTGYYYYFNQETINIINPITEIIQICENKIMPFSSKFDFQYKDLYDIETEYTDFFSYSGNDIDFTHYIENVEHLENFTGSLMGIGDISFDSLDFTLGKVPTYVFSSDLYIDYFKLSGTGSENYRIVKYKDSEGNFKKVFNTLGDSSAVNFNFNELYDISDLNIKTLYFDFTSSSFSDTVSFSSDFGRIITQTEIKTICSNIDDLGNKTNITIDGESYNGNYEDIGKLNISEPVSGINNNTLLDFTPTGTGTVNILKDSLNSVLPIDGYLSFLNITLPETPNTNIIFPYLKLNTNLSFSVETKIVEMQKIEDKLGINGMEKSTTSQLFITLVLAFFYILFRFFLIFILFIFFRLFYYISHNIIGSIFGRDIFRSIGGNVFSGGIYIFVQGSIFLVFSSLFIIIIGIDDLIISIANLGNAIFTTLALSFGDYNTMHTFVGIFFIGLFGVILLMILNLLAQKFGRLN